MHHIKLVRLNIRLVALLAVTVAVLLAASILASPRQTSAASDFEFEGVICLAIEQGVFPQSTLILARFDPVNDLPGVWDLSLVAYEGDTDNDESADVNVGPPCNPPLDNNTFNVLVDFADVEVNSRPSLTATLNGAGTAVEWSSGCSFLEGNNLSVLATFSVDVTGEKTFTKNTGSLDVELFAAGPPADCTGSPSGTLSLALETAMRDSGAPHTSDWDGDGRSDWAELAPLPSKNQLEGCDPFNPADDLCRFGVGGVAELAEDAGTPLAAPDSSGSNTGLIAGIVAAIAAGAVTLGSAVVYAKRRSIQ